MKSVKPLSNMAFAAKVMPDIWKILKTGETSPFFRSFRGGTYVQEFEKQFAHYVGSRYAVSMANGTLALNAAYTVLQCETGRIKNTALTTPWTFAATATELVRTGYDLKFCDVNVATYAMSPLSVMQHINPDVGLVVIMHPLGVPADVHEIIALTKKEAELRPGKRVFVEDACQALGSSLDGKMCGTFADIGCFSLQQTKSLSAGEGGVCVTDSEEYYHRLLHIRNHGNKYEHPDQYPHIIASNYRMTEIQAAIAIHGLRNYPNVLKAQLTRARILKEALDSSKVLHPQDGPPGHWVMNGYIIGATTISSHQTELVENGIHLKILRRLRRFDRKEPGCTIGPGYSETVYFLDVLHQYFPTNAQGIPDPMRNAELLRLNSVWFDIRRMPIEKVKELARVVEKFKA